MKISQLLSSIYITLSNQEHEFVDKHQHVKLNNLNEHDLWIAQNLVRKGIYEISKDNSTLIKKIK